MCNHFILSGVAQLLVIVLAWRFVDIVCDESSVLKDEGFQTYVNGGARSVLHVDEVCYMQ